MKDIQHLINSLSQGPYVVNSLIELIPVDRYKQRRVPGRWSVHEQVCHLVDAQQILSERFKLFAQHEHPHIQAHEPESEPDPDYYLAMDMQKALSDFPRIRNELVSMLNEYDDDYWLKQGIETLCNCNSVGCACVFRLDVPSTLKSATGLLKVRLILLALFESRFRST